MCLNGRDMKSLCMMFCGMLGVKSDPSLTSTRPKKSSFRKSAALGNEVNSFIHLFCDKKMTTIDDTHVK